MAEDQIGTALAPALVSACESRISPIRWFRTDWQAGGAVTGFTTYKTDDEVERPAVVKFPVPPQELQWLRRLQPDQHEHGQIVPQLFASGEALAGYDLAWVIMQQLEHGPLDGQWHGAEFDLLVNVAGRFYAAAELHPATGEPRREPWADFLKRARQAVRDNGWPEAQRWNVALKAFQKKLKKLMKVWDERDTAHWCHGDLHLGNAMTCHPAPEGPAFLFDLARIHIGHWIEDAVYFEHLFWSQPQRLGDRDIVKLISNERKQRGLRAEPNWPRLANIRRALVAAVAPADPMRAAHPHHLHASLEKLEHLLTAVN
ncbi:phosphotransferase [Planctomycetales bacterium ZRK34]|nr:phosphotransferase [Planctomycetales bacterium ZRK34]